MPKEVPAINTDKKRVQVSCIRKISEKEVLVPVKGSREEYEVETNASNITLNLTILTPLRKDPSTKDESSAHSLYKIDRVLEHILFDYFNKNFLEDVVDRAKQGRYYLTVREKQKLNEISK